MDDDVAEVRMLISEDNLPSSFENAIVKDDKTVNIRSSIRSMEDISSWVQEFGRLTNTEWNTRNSCPSGEKFICWKQFVCHHSSFRKVPSNLNKKGMSKNLNCRSSMKIKVKLDTKSTRESDQFVQRGMLGVISIQPFHNHSLNTAETLRFLPAKDLKETFIEYFKNGMGIAKSAKFHERILRKGENIQEVDLSNSRINPTLRTIRHWHDQWITKNPGPRTGPEVIENAAASKEEPHPLEPTVVIKEEPIEFEPTPSTSAEPDCIIKDEFILPHEENAWTSTDSLSSSGVDPAGRTTFSVACLGTDQDKTPSTNPVLGETRKRKANPSKLSVPGPSQKVARTSLEPGIVPTECLPSPSGNAGDSSNPSSLNESRVSDRSHDQFDAFGEYIAAKLRSLDKRACAFAQKAIGDIIFDAEMGKFAESMD